MPPNCAYTRGMAGRALAEEMTGVDAAVAVAPAAGTWAALTAELDAWGVCGRRATFWWRDDDATRPGRKLSRLFNVAGTTPLALAVIPAAARDELAETVDEIAARGGQLSILQHGFAHINHAPATEKKAEFGLHRPQPVMLDELTHGRRRLRSLFGERFRPILVPPWNRVAPALADRLGEAGLVGLSAYGARRHGSGAAVVNTHVDIIDWRGTRRFVGEAAVLRLAISHLAARRTGAADGDEPTGLLTHHRDHDAACWRFLSRLVAVVSDHPAGHWISGFETIAGPRR